MVDPLEACFTSGWHAVCTISRHEKRIAEHLSVRGIEHFFPLYSAQRHSMRGSKLTLRLPLFPNYLFVRFSKRQQVSVLEVPGVLSIVVGAGKKPAMLDADQLEMIRRAVEQENLSARYHDGRTEGTRPERSLRRRRRRCGASVRYVSRSADGGAHHEKHCFGSESGGLGNSFRRRSPFKK